MGWRATLELQEAVGVPVDFLLNQSIDMGHMGMAGMAQNPDTLLFTPKQLVSTDIHLTI